jgi:hypothetical protein
MDAVFREGDAESSVVWSHACTLDGLCAPYALPEGAVRQMDSGPGWARRWTATWKTGKADVVCPVKDLAGAPVLSSVPLRRFSWRSGQEHRPGLECLVSTGRQHGFESLAERRRRLLLALDFAGGVNEVLSQPFRLRFTAEAGPGEHTPDFLALGAGAGWLLDVRPAGRIKPEDELQYWARPRGYWPVGQGCARLRPWSAAYAAKTSVAVPPVCRKRWSSTAARSFSAPASTSPARRTSGRRAACPRRARVAA